MLFVVELCVPMRQEVRGNASNVEELYHETSLSVVVWEIPKDLTFLCASESDFTRVLAGTR